MVIQSEIEYTIDLVTGGLIAHAPALLATVQLQFQPVYFFGASLTCKGFAPILNENSFLCEYLPPQIGGLTDYTIMALLLLRST